ncbi:MAG: sodium:dicarboxylate symporter [Epulopiscium sp. Nele67-Bin005]|nr:MAG: sodium:dicarboxylate symporter [Epulopiscium sp. Nele67-Bin005]
MNSVFFTEFLMISELQTIFFIAILFILFGVINQLQKNKLSFSARTLISTALGLILGLGIQAASGFSTDPMNITFVVETTKWYSLFGNGFIDLIRMLVIPIIMVSIVHLIINMKDGENIGKLVKMTLGVNVSMILIAVVVGLTLGVTFNLGGTAIADVEATTQIKDVTNIVDTIRGLLPSNPVQAMVNTNIIALVIFSSFFGMGAKRMSKKYMDVVKPFFDLTNALHKINMSVAMSVIKYMPFAVMPLLANTIAQRGIASILEVGKFILILYLAVVIMFIIQLAVIMMLGINPTVYFKKGLPVMILAFTSRSSVGCLPLTVETLSTQMGVNDGTASFVAGFGTTAGMQGCAGLFPSLLLVYVANLNAIPIDFNFIATAVVVIVLGSFGIAGIPGAATMSASVTLAGTGLGALFSSVSPIFAIDPILDMGRTFLNVSGAMTNSLMVAKFLGQLDIEQYEDLSLIKVSEVIEG